jgi:hypothetical protein
MSARRLRRESRRDSQILRTEEDSLEARTHLGECFQRMG